MILRNLINNILYKKKLDNFLNEAYYLTLPLFENFVRARYVKLFVNEENIYEYINDFENELTNNFETKKEIYNQIFDLYKDEVPFVGLYRNKSTTISTQSLIGTITPNNYTSFYGIEEWYRK